MKFTSEDIKKINEGALSVLDSAYKYSRGHAEIIGEPVTQQILFKAFIAGATRQLVQDAKEVNNLNERIK